MIQRKVIALIFGLAVNLVFLGPASAADVRIVDVSVVSWVGARTLYTVTDVENAIKNDVAPRWKRYTSLEGSLEDKSLTFELGKTLQEPITLNRPIACEGSNSSSSMASIREETYKRLGIEDWSKRYLVILVPYADCIWSGRALIGNIKASGGVMMLHDSASPFVIAHELGHTLGLGHSNFLRCDSGKNDGAWGSDCKAVEYGGAIDVMGNVDVDNPLSTYSQWLLGYLDKTEVKQSWLTEKIELTAADVAGGTRAIFLRDGKSTYWVEYRRARTGSAYNPGLIIYRTDPPPISSVVSPNPEDALSPEYDEDVTSDIWMLNWDNYTYFRSRANGSMTLPEGKTATVFSGNLSLSASATTSPNKVTVSITRKADTTPPPAPEITDPTTWLYPGVSVIKPGFNDGESAIAGFEADISGKIIPIDGADSEGFLPTYLNPFTPAKTVYLKNLPEGDYSIAVRAIDVWGNKGAWSKSVRAYVDRGDPIVTKDVRLTSIDASTTTISWSGVKDEGIGLCSTILHNAEGFVLARSTEKISPTFKLQTGRALDAKAQVFDCLGNGLTGEVSISSSFTPPSKSKRTGKWSPAPSIYGAGALKCTGKCTASMTTSGNTIAVIGEGSADIALAGKSVTKVSASNAQAFRFSSSVQVTGSRVIRISGSNFVFGGLAKLDTKIGEFKPLARTQEFPDPSLVEPIQKELSRLGFNSADFTQDWTVLPMARGTTLLDPTLDLCNSTYLSESGREYRRQLSVTKVGSPYLFLSTEVVKYKSTLAAEIALAELRKNYSACVTNKGGTENGIFNPYNFQELPISNAQLVDEKSRLIVRASIGSGNATRQLLGFYQYSGAYFTGLYIVLPGAAPIDQAQVLRWYEVASVLAQRMSESKSV